MDKLEKLKQLMALISNDTITPKTLEEFLKLVLNVIKTSKDNFDKLSAENIQTIKESIAYIEKFHVEQSNTLDTKTNATLNLLDGKMTELKGLIDKVKTIKPVDGIDGTNPDPSEVVPLVLAKLPKVEPLKRLEVVKEINTGKKDDLKIELNQIEGLEKSNVKLSDSIINRAIGIVDQRTSFLINKVSNLTSGYIPYTGGTSDVDLGIHNLTVDTNTLFVDSVNHRVGIGTTAPLATLHIATGGAMRTYNAGNTSYVAFSSSGMAWSSGDSYKQHNIQQTNGTFTMTSYDGSAYRTRFGMENSVVATDPSITISGYVSGATTIASFLNNGNVGIGTTAPASLLEVAGATQVGTAAATTSQLTVLGGSGGNSMITLSRTSGTTIAFSWALAGGGLSFTDDTNSKTVLNLFGKDSILQAYIGQKGRINAGAVDSYLAATSYTNAAGADVAGTNLYILGGAGVGTGTLGNIYFQTGVTTATTVAHTLSTKMTILGNGNVGIGTTSPQTKLALSSGSAISFEASAGVTDIALTHSADTLTLSGGNLALGANSLTMTGSLAATGARVTKGWFTDIEITNPPTINGNTTAGILQKKVSLSSAQILALFTTPVELIATPGAGKVIQLIAVTSRLNYVSSTYAVATAIIIGNPSGQGDYNLLNTVQSAVSVINKEFSSDFSNQAVAVIANEAVNISADTSNPTTGDSTLDVYLTYRIITL